MKDKIAIVGHHDDPFITTAIAQAKMSRVEVMVISPEDAIPEEVNVFKRQPTPYKAYPVITQFQAQLTRKERRKLNRKRK